MKLYYQDNGWCGSIVVIAESLGEARALMQNELNYDRDVPIDEYPIENGLVLTCMGDM